MGLLSTIKKFYFYQKYEWLPADFTNFQTWLLGTMGLFSGGTAQVISGCQPSAGSGMQINIASGVCVNASGYPMYLPTTQSATIATPAGNPAISLVVARPLLTDGDNIAQPTVPSTTVPLTQLQGFQIVVLNGTPSATPVAPTPGADDVVLAELHLTSGQVSITSSAFFYDKVNRSSKRASRVTPISANYTCDGTEEIIEVDCTSGPKTVTLASAATVPGQMTRILKIDSSSNALTIASSALISGQSTQVLDDQWSQASVYSNGQSYRML